jgi:succinate dehydrogenase hydrophobic anchor subunit
MEQTIGRPARAETSGAGLTWLVQALSGLLLVLLLGLHMIANHFMLPQGLAGYQDVINYLARPAIFILETVFLIVVIAHALLGARSIIFDTGLSPRAEKAINTILTLLGGLLVAYGLWLTLTIVNR